MRSRKYNKLEWAQKGTYLQTFVKLGRFNRHDTVLDVGTGTGIIAKAVAPSVRSVVGIDISPDMLKFASQNAQENEQYLLGDVHSLKFLDSSFSKITARMVFHHVTQNNTRAIIECHRVLKPGGSMILSEGVPPTKEIKSWYTRMFKLKEHRVTFYEEDLVGLMRKGGFKKIKVATYWLRQASILNWLKSSGIPQTNQDKIFKMHLSLNEAGKKAYNMTLKDGDCFIDMKFLILVGTK